MDDEAQIQKLMGLPGDGQILIDGKSSNPFRLDEDVLSLNEKIDHNTRILVEHEKNRHMTIMQRSEALKPSLPPCLTRATRVLPTSMLERAKVRNLVRDSSKMSVASKSSLARVEGGKASISLNSSALDPEKITIGISSMINSPDDDDKESVQSDKQEIDMNQYRLRPRNQTMNEFIQQKRDVYLCQVIINRKKAQMQKLAKEEELQEKKLVEEEKKIQEEIEALKKTTVRLEAALARSRHRAEKATQKKTTLIKNLKNYQKNVQLIQSDISKNEDLVETYTPYYEFLHLFINDGEDVVKHFNHPSVMTDELSKMEDENLLLVKYCQHFEEIFSDSQAHSDRILDDAFSEERKMREKIQSIKPIELIPYKISPKQKEVAQNTEDEIHHLIELIRKTHFSCLGVHSDIGPIEMLEKIEAKFEEMYKKCNEIDPTYLHEKKAYKEYLRREQQRKEKNLKREQEQQKKIDQAIERANRPIPQKTGRILRQRMLPIKIVKPNEELIKQKMYREKMEYELLYGEELIP